MVLCGISTPFGVLFPCLGKVAHALLTRPPLKQLIASYSLSPLDLHVLGTPPAFVLSQDQTLSFNPLSLNQVSPTKFHSFGITVLFALLLFCIVFKVRTSLAGAFEAARATSFVSILLFRPLVKGFWKGFCGFFETFGVFRTLFAGKSHHFRVLEAFSRLWEEFRSDLQPVLSRSLGRECYPLRPIRQQLIRRGQNLRRNHQFFHARKALQR